MTEAATHFEQCAADASTQMEDAATKLRAEQRRLRCVPQSYDSIGEIINVRTLLRRDRPAEALERLEHWLDRRHSGWRTVGEA